MITIIIGDLGSGKTALATNYLFLAKYSGYDLFSNYKLYNIPYYYLAKTEDLNLIRETSSNKKKIGLDEAWINADARRSGSIINLFSSKKVLQSRKMKADVVVTTQDIDQIDKRIRKLATVIIEPEIVARYEDNAPAIIKGSFYWVKKDREFTRYIPMTISPYCYDTDEEIQELEQEDIVGKMIENYMGYNGDMKKLKSELVTIEGLKPGEAKQVIDFISTH